MCSSGAAVSFREEYGTLRRASDRVGTLETERLRDCNRSSQESLWPHSTTDLEFICSPLDGRPRLLSCSASAPSYFTSSRSTPRSVGSRKDRGSVASSTSCAATYRSTANSWSTLRWGPTAKPGTASAARHG